MIPLAVPNLAGREGEYLQECVSSTFVSTVGAFVGRFEEMVAESAGTAHGIATSTGTTGLHAALLTAGVGRDDLVILPAFTFIASANAISHCGATPWLFDCCAENWTLDAGQLGDALARDTRRDGDGRLVHGPSGRRVAAIMPVYTMGAPADMDAIAALAAEYRLPVVADAAAAHGALYRGRPAAGAGADLAVFSFNGNKTVTAGGGGCIVTEDDALARRARHLTTTARVGPGYDHDAVGYNYRLTNIQAAVGCAQMENLDAFVVAKRRIAARYARGFADMPALAPFPEADWGESAHWFSGAFLEAASPARMEALRAGLREAGIDARPFWKPMHLQAPYADAPREALDRTEAVWDRVLTLPCSTHLSTEDQDAVIAATRRVAAEIATA